MENKIRVVEWPGNGTFDGLVGERLGVDGKRQLASLGLSSRCSAHCLLNSRRTYALQIRIFRLLYECKALIRLPIRVANEM